jgi:hypothetical protein
MHFSRVLLTRKPDRASPTFTWIECVAIPLALSVMEAQPLAMVLALGALLVSGTSANALLSVGQLTWLLLGFLWWAIALAFFHARGRLRSTRVLALLRLGSLLVVWLVLTVLKIGRGWSKTDDLLVPAECLFTFWLWRRSLTRARLGFAYETLATSFKGSLGILLSVLLLALLIPRGSLLLSMLEASLTTFFFCGLVTLSLTRLGILRQVRSVNGRQADPTRTWLAALLLFSALLIGLVFLLEAVFSFTSLLWIVHVLQPVWDALGTLLGWLLYALVFVVIQPLFLFFSWLIGLLRGQEGTTSPASPPTSPFTHLANAQHPVQLSPELLTLGRWGVLAVTVLVLIVLVWTNLRRWFLPYDAEQLEETREGLDRRALRAQRRQQRSARSGKSSSTDGFPETESARAYYRLLLQATASASSELARRSDETPLEYEQRLHTQAPGFQQEPEPAPPSHAAILHELTQGYMEERYGQHTLDPHWYASVRRWVPHLLALFRKA